MMMLTRVSRAGAGFSHAAKWVDAGLGSVTFLLNPLPIVGPKTCGSPVGRQTSNAMSKRCVRECSPIFQSRPVASSPYYPVALLPWCLTTLLIALWGSRARLYNDCSQVRTSDLLFSSLIFLSPYTAHISATDSHRYIRKIHPVLL